MEEFGNILYESLVFFLCWFENIIKFLFFKVIFIWKYIKII